MADENTAFPSSGEITPGSTLPAEETPPAAYPQEETQAVPPFPISTAVDTAAETVPPAEPSLAEIPPAEMPPPPSEEPSGPLELIKKILPPALIALALLLVLFFGMKLIRRGGPVSKGGTLTYWGLWEPESVMTEVIAAYQKDHPNVKITYVQQSPTDYRERIQSAFSRGEGPDIFRLHNTWLPMFRNELAPLGADIISEKDYYPVVKKDLAVGNTFYGVPLMMDTLALYINNEIFKAAGKTPPTTWEDLRKTALELTVKDRQGKIQQAGIALGTTNNTDHWSDILGLMMYQNGVTLERPTGQNAEDALSFYSIFYAVDRVWDETLPPSTISFAGGKVAMFFGPSWRVFDIKAINPGLDFQVVAVPQLPGTNVTWASYWAEGIWNKSKNKEEATKFLKYLAQKEALQKLYQAESSLRAFGELYPRTEMAGLLAGNPLAAPFLAQATTARSWYVCSRTRDNGLNDRMIKYFEDAVNSINRGGNAREALATASQGVSQLLTQYGIAATR